MSALGRKTVNETENFASPIGMQLKKNDSTDLEIVFKTLTELIHQLNNSGILIVQRTCFGCKFFDKSENKSRCILMDKELLSSDIRVDCPEHEENPAGKKG